MGHIRKEDSDAVIGIAILLKEGIRQCVKEMRGREITDEDDKKIRDAIARAKKRGVS